MINFAVIGVNHNHIYGQIACLLGAGANFKAWHAPEPELCAEFGARFRAVPYVADKRAILENPDIQLVLSAGIPADRAPLGVEVMRHGKDYMSDKPGMTTQEQLSEVRRVQAETKRIYSICYSEHFETRCTVKAGELVHAGAIGKLVQTVGLGPHRTNLPSERKPNALGRPTWFFDKNRYGGILCDIASHQFEQFLFFTGSQRAEIVSSQVGNFKHPQYTEFEDFGDCTIVGHEGIYGNSTGYIRVDWYTPDGLPNWGDGRLTLLGTEGYIELRKYVDIGGRKGTDHLFMVNHEGMEVIDCNDVKLPYGEQLIYDVLNRTETAMPQERCFLAMELALSAQQKATRIN
jgi:predicted dehydrogenase